MLVCCKGCKERINKSRYIYVHFYGNVCFRRAAHVSGLLSELIIAHLSINVRAAESNGLFIL